MEQEEEGYSVEGKIGTKRYLIKIYSRRKKIARTGKERW
jgi:hypothetical protein